MTKNQTLTATLTLATLVFLIDVSIPLGVAGGVPYVAVILLSLGLRVRVILFVALLCSALTILGYFMSPGGGEFWKVLSNRFLALFAIWITALLGIERIRTYKKLMALSLRSDAITAAIPDIIMEVDENKVYTWANQTGLNFFGDDVVGKEVAQYFVGEQSTYEIVQPLFGGSEDTIYVESWQKRRDGEKRLLAWWCRVLKSAEGNIVGALSTARDITETKKAEKVLLESEERFRNLVETTSDWVWEVDKNGVYTYVSPKIKDLLGYYVEEVVGRRPFEFMPHDEAERIGAVFKSISERREPFDRLENINLHKDGRQVILETSGVPIFDNNGNYKGYRGIDRDITKQKNIEKVLKAQDVRFRSFLENSPTAIFIKDLDSRYLYVNQYYEKTFGVNKDEITGKTDQDIFSKKIAEAFRINDLKIIEDNSPLEFEELVPHDDGLHTYISIKFPLYDESGKIEAICGIATDITDRKKIEEDLKESRKLAEVANIAKSQFLASMSHEIRTPMNVMLGMADVLKDTKLTPEQEKHLNKLSSSGDTLLHIINDILDFSKIEIGHLDMEEVELNIEILLSEVTSFMGTLAHGKNLKLSYHVEPDVPAKLTGDLERLRQILFNIVGNAIKFTEKGRIDINVSKTGAKDDITELEFYVKDTGIGIPEDKLDTIFERFTQVDSSTTRGFGGTGLGTTISKMLVEKMGGRIWAESELGKGSTFHFTVKLKIAEISDVKKTIKKKVEEKIISWKQPLKILVVDDSEDNLMLMQLYLGKTPHIIDTAENGKIAVEKFKSGDYGLVLMDLEMPVMDGYTATKEIRKWEAQEKKKKAAIIALTAHALKEHKQNSLDAGCNAHITKPIKKQVLLEAIHKYTKKQVESRV